MAKNAKTTHPWKRNEHLLTVFSLEGIQTSLQTVGETVAVFREMRAKGEPQHMSVMASIKLDAKTMAF